MRKNRHGFTFIEVLVAMSILSVAVFGVYRLIGENTKVISRAGDYQQVNLLFPVLEECIETLNYDFSNTTVGSGYSIYLGSTFTGCISTSSANLIDNIEYYLSGTITNTGTNFIERETSIMSDQINTKIGYFKQIK